MTKNNVFDWYLYFFPSFFDLLHWNRAESKKQKGGGHIWSKSKIDETSSKKDLKIKSTAKELNWGLRKPKKEIDCWKLNVIRIRTKEEEGFSNSGRRSRRWWRRGRERLGGFRLMLTLRY